MSTCSEQEVHHSEAQTRHFYLLVGMFLAGVFFAGILYQPLADQNSCRNTPCDTSTSYYHPSLTQGWHGVGICTSGRIPDGVKAE